MKHKIMKTSDRLRQSGTALLLCLILLISLTLIALASVQTGIMEVRMAGAIEEQMNASQTAHSAIDFTVSDTTYLPTTGATGIPVDVALTPNTLTTDTFYGDGILGVQIEANATRIVDCGTPPRTRISSSLLAFSSFEYRIAADVDRTSIRRGKSHQRQGWITLGPKC